MRLPFVEPDSRRQVPGVRGLGVRGDRAEQAGGDGASDRRMTTKAREYREEALHAAAEIAREYFANEAPSVGAPCCWPDMPDDFVPASDTEAVPLEYIELTVPGRGTFLAILTRIPVEGGPGAKYYVKPIGGK